MPLTRNRQSQSSTRVATAIAVVAVALQGCGEPNYEVEDYGMMTTASSLEGPAGTLHVDDGGHDGTPVVFLHAYSGNSSHWADQLAHVRASRRAIAIDLRGHGASDTPADNDYAIASLARDLEAVADTLNLTRFLLVGHSLGGAAAIEYAGAHPDRVAGLLLVTTPGKLPDEQIKQIAATLDSNYAQVMQQIWNRLLTGADPEVRARIEQERDHLSEAESRSIIRATFAYDPVPALRRYHGPVMTVTVGDGSPGDLHTLIPGLAHRTIVGTSHWPQLDKPDEFNRVLDEFLATTP